MCHKFSLDCSIPNSAPSDACGSSEQRSPQTATRNNLLHISVQNNPPTREATITMPDFCVSGYMIAKTAAATGYRRSPCRLRKKGLRKIRGRNSVVLCGDIFSTQGSIVLYFFNSSTAVFRSRTYRIQSGAPRGDMKEGTRMRRNKPHGGACAGCSQQSYCKI